jgi:exonuclease III
MNVDIIAMQEIWGDGASVSFENLKTKLDGWDGSRKSSGLAYLYKTELIFNRLSEIEELNDILRTPYLLSINIDGENIFIINNHLRANYNDGNWDEDERKEALGKLEEYINQFLPEENVILLGDLNDELNDSMNVFQNFINDSTNYKFVDMDLAYGSKANWSYPGWPSHLDHILITNELFDEFDNEGSSVQTIRLEEYFDNGWTEYENYISDHRPVGLRLKFSQ